MKSEHIKDVLNALTDLKKEVDGGIKCGAICYEISLRTYCCNCDDYESELHSAFKSWRWYSGNLLLPVPHPLFIFGPLDLKLVMADHAYRKARFYKRRSKLRERPLHRLWCSRSPEFRGLLEPNEA